MASVRISIADLWTYGVTDAGGTEREPLTRLGKRRNCGHIHGKLILEIAGRVVPYLGSSGPDDVCLNTWVVELCMIANALSAADGAYTFDEGEQGQPALAFARVGDEVTFSIIESVLSDGAADAAWQGVRFPYRDLRAAVLLPLGVLRSELHRQIPDEWEPWWSPEAHVTNA